MSQPTIFPASAKSSESCAGACRMNPVGCHNCVHAIYPDRQAYIAYQPGQSYLVSCPQNPGQRRVLMTTEKPAAPVCPHHLEAA